MSDEVRYTVTAEVWRHPGEAGWHFLTLPVEVADEIRTRFSGAHRPFGSLPVRAHLGASSWSTSIFADRTAGSYLLPLKAAPRREEGVGHGDTVTVTLLVGV